MKIILKVTIWGLTFSTFVHVQQLTSQCKQAKPCKEQHMIVSVRDRT